MITVTRTLIGEYKPHGKERWFRSCIFPDIETFPETLGTFPDAEARRAAMTDMLRWRKNNADDVFLWQFYNAHGDEIRDWHIVTVA